MLDPVANEQENQSEQLVEVLNQYLEYLQAKDQESCHSLQAVNPELKKLMACLDSLECLAPDSENSSQQNQTSEPEDPTLLFSSPNLKPSVPQLITEFGKYELLEELGRGGMGVVYKARQKDLNRIVALKTILSHQFASEEEVRRFYLEAQAAGRLQHSNIVAIHEVGQYLGQHYFTMDYISGNSLANIKLKPETSHDQFYQIASLMQQVSRAVHYLHSKEIIHRDLKPSNILIDENGAAYVTDFGLAKVFDLLQENSASEVQTQSGMIVGTPSYMSPEQAAGQLANISARSDIFCLGIILYELLTNVSPFKQNTPLDSLVYVIEGEPPLPHTLNAKIPHQLELICLKCLEKDPELRYQTASELADELERFIAGEPIHAQPAGFKQKFQRWFRRQPALASRLSAIVLSAGIIQTVYSTQGTDFNYHFKIMTIFCLWGILALFFQWGLDHLKNKGKVRFCWAAADVSLLTGLLILVDSPIGILLIGYPMLIVAAGLFFYVRLVFFTTTLSMLAFAILVFLRPELTELWQYPVIYAVVLAILGTITAYQIFRVRVLSRYYELRRPER
ncbi:serine/threonine protein kinase [Gimesia aquarii]|uniref:non-specific serine/threonine protein kinase n=1 Tax=Gimesia aquarii TaxID=2527964 RepID=A0A517WV34_9PLAN|nr:serine/threonine-protein kinase [Gimesia aquarii]QDU09130.1 Serine/threonine-protein kinase PrkC [Gimesia aquarii]